MDNNQKQQIYEALMTHTGKEIRNFAKRHGVCLGYDASTKSNAARRVVSQLSYDGHDFEVIQAMVDTPSSFLEVSV